MTYPSNDPLYTLKRRATLRFRWALYEGGLCRPEEMRERTREIVRDELSVLTDPDMLELARRYRKLRRHPAQGILPWGAAREGEIRENLREMLAAHLGALLREVLSGGADVRVRVRRNEIRISGIGGRPSQPKPDPRNRSISPNRSHQPS